MDALLTLNYLEPIASILLVKCLRTHWSKINSKTSLYLSHIFPFSSFTFPAAPYLIFLLYLIWFPLHFLSWRQTIAAVFYPSTYERNVEFTSYFICFYLSYMTSDTVFLVLQTVYKLNFLTFCSIFWYKFKGISHPDINCCIKEI